MSPLIHDDDPMTLARDTLRLRVDRAETRMARSTKLLLWLVAIDLLLILGSLAYSWLG